METSSGFAAKVEQQIAKTGKIKSRGVKQAGFLVLWRTAMPSVLVELGFLTNPSDRAVLKTSDGQQIVSKAIFNAVKQYKQERDARIHKPAVKPVPVQRKDSALLR